MFGTALTYFGTYTTETPLRSHSERNSVPRTELLSRHTCDPYHRRKVVEVTPFVKQGKTHVSTAERSVPWFRRIEMSPPSFMCYSSPQAGVTARSQRSSVRNRRLHPATSLKSSVAAQETEPPPPQATPMQQTAEAPAGTGRSGRREGRRGVGPRPSRHSGQWSPHP